MGAVIVDEAAPALPARLKVVIIDDAFDDIAVSSINDEIRRAFLEEIDAESELADELNGSEFTFSDPDEFSDAFFSALISGDSPIPALATAFRVHIDRLERERSDVENLARLLEADETLEVHRLGATHVEQGRAKEFMDAQIVFLDYYLGPPGEDAVRRAQKAARELRPGPPEREAGGPLIVLMSSRPEAESRRSQFRKQAEVLGAAFFFYPKEQLDDAWKVQVSVETLKAARGYTRQIESFMSALSREASTAQEVLIKKVGELEIADYSYLQVMRLRDDGHPFGDYLAWIFGAEFMHELFEVRLRDSKAALNDMMFQERLVSHRPPSPIVSEFYMSAVFERGLGALSPHPRQDPAGEGGDIPMLLMGDIFHSGQRAVMVATADCDMAMAPDGKRRPDRQQSILLIPGKLVDIAENTEEKDSTARTEVYEADGKTYAIMWELDKWFSKPFGEVWSWLREGQFELVNARVRLRPLFALSVQQKMHAHAARVGLPKEPPIFRPVSGKLYWNDGAKVTLQETFKSGEINLVRGEKNPKCWMDISVVSRLRVVLENGVAEWEKQLAGMKQGQQAQKIRKNATKASEALKNHALWTAVACTPIALQGGTELLTIVQEDPDKKAPPGGGGLVLYIPKDDE